MLKKIQNFFYFKVLLDKVKIRKKNLNFQNGPNANFKPKFDGNFVKSQSRKPSLK